MDYAIFRLNIKGSKSQCLEAIDSHGLTAIGCVTIDRGRSCVIDVESCHDFLTTWFNEPSECLVGIGFPSGTLLTISQHQSYTKPLDKLV